MNTTIRNEKLFCLNCGGEYAVPFPIEVPKLTKKMEQFNALHSDCEPTWVEPSADLKTGINERAMWWISNGEVGNSSKTMWNCFMGNSNYPIKHPYDPDDFKRCHKLLESIPEWKEELHRLKSLSKPWENLVNNWDQLTEMYLENERTNWENYKQIGMYDFMQKLIN